MALEKFATASSRRQQASGLCSPDLGVRSPEKKKPSTCFQGAGFWRRPTDSLSPVHSPSRAFPSTSPLPRGDVLLRHAAFRRAVLGRA